MEQKLQRVIELRKLQQTNQPEIDQLAAAIEHHQAHKEADKKREGARERSRSKT